MASSAQRSKPRPGRGLDDILMANARYRRGKANRRQANLTGQDLHGMDLPGYQLDGAILKNANFHGADLSGTTLTDADISGADFRDARVTLEQARSAKGWLLARWSPEILNALGLPENHNDNVRAKLFRGHALAGAHLNDLDLSRAVLADAILDNATFYRRQP
jgi:uncharacterized protein YjbI with pentapeptide repeats